MKYPFCIQINPIRLLRLKINPCLKKIAFKMSKFQFIKYFP